MIKKNNPVASLSKNCILGTHPSDELFGCHTVANEGYTQSAIIHRALDLEEANHSKMVAQLRPALIKHHASDEKISRIKHQLERLGFDYSRLSLSSIPKTDKTRKGNLAEIFLAEYITASTDLNLPIYRLRFNPNVEQSMKGDDLLAFDFSKKSVKIIVGEAKFRTSPNKNAVQEMINALMPSNQAGVPASIQFIASLLFEIGRADLGRQVEDCAEGIVNGKHDIMYVGFMMSSNNCKSCVDKHTESRIPNLAVLSFSSKNLKQFYEDCFMKLEEEAYGSPK